MFYVCYELNAPRQFIPILNFHSPIFSLVHLVWLHSIMLIPYLEWEYYFSLMAIFYRNAHYSIKQGLGIHNGIHGEEGMDWLDLAQDREKSWAIVTTVMSP